jgi:hypothetical protein
MNREDGSKLLHLAAAALFMDWIAKNIIFLHNNQI